MKVLVLGATGTVGSQVVQALLARGDQLRPDAAPRQGWIAGRRRRGERRRSHEAGDARLGI